MFALIMRAVEINTLFLQIFIYLYIAVTHVRFEAYKSWLPSLIIHTFTHSRIRMLFWTNRNTTILVKLIRWRILRINLYPVLYFWGTIIYLYGTVSTIYHVTGHSHFLIIISWFKCYHLWPIKWSTKPLCYGFFIHKLETVGWSIWG